MRIQIEPIQLSIIRTCNEMELQILCLTPEQIQLHLQFNCNGTGFYSCQIEFTSEEINAFYNDELDMLEWIIARFNLKCVQTFNLKRKELMDAWNMNKKSKFILYHTL